MHAELAVAAERVANDPEVMRAEHTETVPVRSRVVVSGAVPDHGSGRPGDHVAEELVLGGGELLQEVVARAREDHAGCESAQRAISNRDPGMAVVCDPDVADLATRAARDRLAVARDRVPIQVEGDVVRADDDSVARTVREVAVECRVGRDRVPALETGRRRLARRRGHARQGKQGNHREHSEREPSESFRDGTSVTEATSPVARAKRGCQQSWLRGSTNIRAGRLWPALMRPRASSGRIASCVGRS